MANHAVTFDVSENPVTVQTGTLLTEAAAMAGVEVAQPCGGQGRCGRCMVRVTDGDVRRRSTLRLSPADVEYGFALACQSVVEGDVSISVPPQEKVERRLSTDRTVAQVTVPEGYRYLRDQPVRRLVLDVLPPSMDNQTDDWSRLQNALRRTLSTDVATESGISTLEVSLPLLRRIGHTLREGNWQATAILDMVSKADGSPAARLIDLLPGHVLEDEPLWGVAIDIGTTTVTVWLVNLIDGEVRSQAAEYNGQIARGEDVISRIIYASKDRGGEEMQRLVLESINKLLQRSCRRAKADHSNIVKATIAGNSTMMHLLLGIPAESIRLMPFVTAVNAIPQFRAEEIGLDMHPEGTVDCLPGVASYVGANLGDRFI